MQVTYLKYNCYANNSTVKSISKKSEKSEKSMKRPHKTCESDRVTPERCKASTVFTGSCTWW